MSRLLFAFMFRPVNWSTGRMIACALLHDGWFQLPEDELAMVRRQYRHHTVRCRTCKRAFWHHHTSPNESTPHHG